jgi:nucleotide-binding universal stress UspA family protein
MSYHKLLVPLDGSKLAEKVLDYLPLVAKQGAHIHLLTVAESYSVEMPPMMISTWSLDLAVTRFTPPQSSLETQEPMREYLYSIGRRLFETGYAVTIEIVTGDIVESIIAVAQKYEVILMATHGRTGLSKLVMGSITEGVLHQAVCPVLVVPVHPNHVQHFSGETDQNLRILISLDGSPESETILPIVDKLLAQKVAKVILLRVAHPQHPISDSTRIQVAGQALSEFDDYDSANRPDEVPLHYYLEHVAKRLVSANREILTRVGNRERIDEILFFANLYHVDLIAMATHGRTGLNRLLFGSITENVLHHTPCPMLISRILDHDPVTSETVSKSLVF